MVTKWLVKARRGRSQLRNNDRGLRFQDTWHPSMPLDKKELFCLSLISGFQQYTTLTQSPVKGLYMSMIVMIKVVADFQIIIRSRNKKMVKG